jgi:eukaryotic-like serine/threonine-protein kinase
MEGTEHIVAKSPGSSEEIVAFLRKRDYKLVRELGQGACGKTVLLYDEQIDEHFVCKKYVPYSESDRQELFAGFVREVKLLHKVLHQNVVRVFNYYLYPDQLTGYILMEYVDGSDIDDHVAAHPEQSNDLFLQAVSGFSYLERSGILHRDIRPGNLMVRTDGLLKIIDLGFGKRIERSDDFDKSISLNWWCEPPSEFQASRYDFKTEVYFVGKLFERMIQESNIRHFKYMDTLAAMCQRNPTKRVGGFAGVERTIRNELFFEMDFSGEELQAYRRFSDALCRQVAKVESSAKYATDVDKLRVQLNDAYQRFMLEETVPDAAVVLRCFLVGMYHYRKAGLEVAIVRDFLKLLRTTADERARVILANLHTRLDSLPRYTDVAEDDIPF